MIETRIVAHVYESGADGATVPELALALGHDRGAVERAVKALLELGTVREQMGRIVVAATTTTVGRVAGGHDQ